MSRAAPVPGRAAVLLALAAAAALPAPPAAAQLRSIEEQRAGAWLYRAGRTGERTACILETERPAGTLGGHVRLAMLNQPFEFHLSLRDLRWRIPPGTTGLVRLEIEGGATRYGANLRARQAGPDRTEVDLAGDPEGAARILAALRAGQRLSVRMPDGQVIGAPLAGTAVLVGRFHDCFRRRLMPRQTRAAAPATPPLPPPAAAGRPAKGSGAAATAPRNPLAGPDAATRPDAVWR
ncbi:hypothetical protein GCM10010964_01570 [Caldovatus sediminis]|uniref:Invasion associated locus B family protein n=1 Tax=Caldovatus sediminis TaxID=2041189 RepID=A0A8J3EBV3_9PROT|nr:hypothetical protein [Caldovatus sediminis]GGG16990.1 hypothetical protein GCM10010964_01570 [Caldovatus sediminis]